MPPKGLGKMEDRFSLCNGKGKEVCGWGWERGTTSTCRTGEECRMTVPSLTRGKRPGPSAGVLKREKE